MHDGGSPRPTRWIAGVLLAAVGLVWIGQGTGLLQGSSFMVGDPLWAIIGVLLVVAGVILTLRGRRPSPGA